MSNAAKTRNDLPAERPASTLAHPLTGALTPRMAPGALAALYRAFIESRAKREDRA